MDLVLLFGNPGSALGENKTNEIMHGGYHEFPRQKELYRCGFIS